MLLEEWFLPSLAVFSAPQSEAVGWCCAQSTVMAVSSRRCVQFVTSHSSLYEHVILGIEHLAIPFHTLLCLNLAAMSAVISPALIILFFLGALASNDNEASCGQLNNRCAAERSEFVPFRVLLCAVLCSLGPLWQRRTGIT